VPVLRNLLTRRLMALDWACSTSGSSLSWKDFMTVSGDSAEAGIMGRRPLGYYIQIVIATI
jgi:hypothetical protein